MNKILLFSAMIFLSFSGYAQSGIIKGKVQDNQGIALEFANILLLNETDSALVKGVVSDMDGAFILENVDPGTYMVSASSIGFSDAYSSLIKSNDDEITIEALVMKDGIDLSEVTVVATKPFIEMKADKIVVNVENSTVNSGNSALEILQKSPGVTVDKDNNISLRGKQGVLVLIDGKNQYMSGDELTNLLQSMPAENIQNIEIITNPSSKYDAEGNSGIINIRLRKNSSLGMNGAVNIGSRHGEKFSHNTGVDFNYRSNKINVYGSGSRSEWAGFQALNLMRIIPYNNGNTTFDQTSDMTYDQTSYNAKLGVDYTLSDKTTVGILYKMNDGDDMWVNDNITNIFGQNAPSFDILDVHGVN
ncbi:MAG: TonB-dependent receptor, partial [Bacteroidia bacterium]|nr:TonB-dependent receptor [Bacteroidia bacterium]